MTSRTPRRHRRLALMAAGTAAAMVLLPGAASAQVVHSSAQQVAGTSSLAAAPSDPVVPSGPHAPDLSTAPGDSPGGPAGVEGLVAQIEEVVGKPATPGLTGSDGHGHHGEVVHRDDSPDSDHLDDPERPDHASGAVADVDLLKSHLLDITKYEASIEDNDEPHADSTVLGLGGSRIVGSSADSRDHNKEGENGDALKTCNLTGGVLCLSLLYHNTVATEEHDSSLAAARGGVLALCLLGDNKEVTASYECGGALSLGVAEGLGIAERDKKYGHTKADSANELLNLCIGKREKLTTPCDGIGLQAVHVDSKSKSEKPETERGSFLLGIDLNGSSTYLLDGPTALALPNDCGDSAILCLFLNQGKSVIFKNPKGAGSVQEMLRLDVLNKTLLVVLGQAETLAHETEGRHHHKKDEPEKDHGDKGDEGGKGEEGGGPELAETGADVAQLLAGGFLLTGLGALTVAASRRRAGKHSL